MSGRNQTSTHADQVELMLRFKELAIDARTVPYPQHQTVEEGKALRGNMRGIFTKNLLLKDKKGQLYLIVAHEDQAINLKTLHHRVGASRSLRFAPVEQMRMVLGVETGALTPLALINDHENLVTVVVDANLLDSEQLNFHPMSNTESTGIRPSDLMNFIASCGRKELIVNFC